VTGGGPSGVVLDEPRNRLYVMTRFDNAVKSINLTTRAQVASIALPNPEPASVVQGRPLLYDAVFSSANGEASCASCHIFGDKDELAWDLGNPDDVVTANPIPKRLASGLEITLFQLVTTFPGSLINGTGNPNEFHPMKGPMTTQTLRGLVNEGAMHWRGDRANGFFGVDTRTQPPFDSNLSFNNFIVAFPGTARPRQHADAAGNAALHGLPAAGAVAAEPGAQSRQLLELGAGRRAQRSTSARGARTARRRVRTAASTATAVTS
jgi:hypothetical protein